MAQPLLSTYARLMSCAQKTPFTIDGARPVCERTDISFSSIFDRLRQNEKIPFLSHSGQPCGRKVSAAFFACNCFCVCEAENIMSRSPQESSRGKARQAIFSGRRAVACLEGPDGWSGVRDAYGGETRFRHPHPGRKNKPGSRDPRRPGIYARFFRSPSRSEFKRMVLRVLSKNGSKSLFSSWMFCTLCTVCKKGKLFCGA